MKLCPQCEFIYEDDQSLCDMDGKELVYDRGRLAFAENAPPLFAQPEGRAVTPVGLPPEQTPDLFPELPASLPSRRQSRSLAMVAAAGFILVALLFMVYYVRTHQPRSGNANQASSQSQTQSSGAQMPASDLDAAPPGSPADSPEQSSSEPENLSPSLSAAPESSGRKQVRTIQRPARLEPRSRSTAIRSEEKKRKTENATAQGQPRVSKPEAPGAKKESRVSSFLKKTGQILKKPFKF